MFSNKGSFKYRLWLGLSLALGDPSLEGPPSCLECTVPPWQAPRCLLNTTGKGRIHCLLTPVPRKPSQETGCCFHACHKCVACVDISSASMFP